MCGSPFALVAEVEIAERGGEGEVPIVGARAPGWRARLQVIEGTIDLSLLALLPGGVPLLLRAEALLIDEQQRRIEDAVRQGGEHQGLPALRPALGEQDRCGRQA